MDKILAQLDRHVSDLSVMDGFTFPDINKLKYFSGLNVQSLGENRFVTFGNVEGNHFFVNQKQRCVHPVRVIFHAQASNNILIIGEGAEVYGTINIHGSNNVIVIGEDIDQWSMLNIRIWSNQQFLFWGKGSTSNGVEIVMQGDERRILVGDDCMFANNIYVRNSDMHPLIDLENKEWINRPGDVIISQHVWVCQDALILKSAEIGKGSVVGAKSLVNKSMPAYSLIGGAPSKVIRTNISWDRPEYPRSDVIDLLVNDCFSEKVV